MSNKPIKTKTEYQSPQAEVLEVRVERGFVGSGNMPEPERGTEGLSNSNREYTFN